MESNVSTSSSGPRSMKGLVISIISLILFVAIIAFAVHESSKATVTVQVDGEEYVVKTHASTVADLMAEQGWDYQEHDLIEPALDAEISGNMTVSWKKAVQVFATFDGEEKTIWTTADTVEQLIDEIDLQVKKHDKLKPSLETAITEGLELNYESAFQVELISDGEERKVWTTSTTVADFLEREEIELGELDRVEPELSDEIDQETDIRVIRVEKVTDVVEESVAFATVTRKDEKLDSGKEKVVEEGQEGKVAHHYEVILEDGEE
ncbi:ubiquitin-like domain-containing protein, partial [Halalkalibacterium halodurans]|nr:ubiquitin-like domain-containing protein [Halalkalibacterium halodurans]